MKHIIRTALATFAVAFFMVAAQAQNPGAVTNHAFPIGKGLGQQGFTSLLCGSAQLAVGQAAADPICRTITGDVTLSAAGAITLATVNANVGTFGSATQCITTTQNAKGLTTAISAATCTPAIGSITGLGTGIATALGVNVGTAGSPVINGGVLGTPSSGTLTNATGLPISTGVSGLGTGVATALGVNVGTAGAPVVNGGALGTPSSGTLTNATGLPISTGVSGMGTGVAAAHANNLSAAGGLTSTIASGTSALGTGAISSATCATVVTTAATNTATTDVVMASFNGDPTAVTGYVPLTTGMLTIIVYPTANNVNFKVCNNSASSITPGAITLNWRVVR